MIFNTHSEFADRHAFLSPSNPAWLRYDDDKIDKVFMTAMAAQRGSDLHDLAMRAIRLGVKLPEEPTTTLNMYVNDAIGYRMTPEQILFYSLNCFGTADTVSFRRDLLRIHDLKTGMTKTSFDQLLIYAALFCLEYRIRPFDIGIELRIYQNDDVKVLEADPDDVVHIMDKIKSFDRRINEMRMEVSSW